MDHVDNIERIHTRHVLVDRYGRLGRGVVRVVEDERAGRLLSGVGGGQVEEGKDVVARGIGGVRAAAAVPALRGRM